MSIGSELIIIIITLFKCMANYTMDQGCKVDSDQKIKYRIFISEFTMQYELVYQLVDITLWVFG